MTRLNDHDAHRILKEQAERGQVHPFAREWLEKYDRKLARKRFRARLAQIACVTLLASAPALLFVSCTN